jgi:hypothetical protein
MHAGLHMRRHADYCIEQYHLLRPRKKQNAKGTLLMFSLDFDVCHRYEVGSPEAETCCTPNDTYAPWKIVYYSTACLGWVALPLFRHALLSGHFTWYARLQAGCRVAVRGWIRGLCVSRICAHEKGMMDDGRRSLC